MLLQRIQQSRGKPKVPFHKLRSLLGSVHPRQIEHKPTIFAESIKQSRICINVIFIDILNGKVRKSPILTIFDILQCSTKVLSHKPLRTSNKNFHIS